MVGGQNDHTEQQDLVTRNEIAWDRAAGKYIAGLDGDVAFLRAGGTSLYMRMRCGCLAILATVAVPFTFSVLTVKIPSPC